MLSLQPGQRISQYELIEKIGQGGMGIVWKALDTGLKRRVAIKFLPTALSPESGRRVRFRREAQTAAALDHPHIAVIYEVGEVEDHPFIVMQLLEGKSLRTLMQGRPMPLLEWQRLAVPMGEALAYAHRHGIVHRDLKPDNVMLTSEGKPKIVDFGLAKLFDPAAFGSDGGERRETLEQDLTRVGEVFGTFSYMSPEQARGDRVDHRSDIFSLGVILYEMAGGRRPFEAGNPAGTLAAIVSSPPQPLSALAPGIEPAAERVILRALEKDPGRRYQQAGDLVAELEELGRERETGGAAGATGKGRVRPAWALPLVALLSVMAAAAVALWEPRVTVTTNASQGVAPPPSIAVVGFENLTAHEDPEGLGRILMSLITTDLTESGGLRVASSSRVLEARRNLAADRGGFDASSASRVARELGTDLMLAGQVTESEGGLLLQTELVDVATGNTIHSATREAETGEGLFQVAGAVADDVRDHLEIGRGAPEPDPFDLAQALTSRPAAYRAYVEGERAFQQMDWLAAAAAFQRAVRIDPSFALASYRAGMALSFEGDDRQAIQALRDGLAHVRRLPARWQTIYRALLTWHEGEAHDAFIPLNRLVRGDPALPDAYYLLGEIRTHSSRHFDHASARRLFQRARELDPAFRIVNDHLVDAYLAAGDIDSAERLVEAVGLEGAGGRFARESELKLLAARSRFEELGTRAAEMVEELPDAQGEIWPWLIDAHLHLGRWSRALELAEVAVAGKHGRQRPSALIKRGQALAGMGRLREALVSFRRAQSLTDEIVPRIREFGTQGHFYAASILAAGGRLREAADEVRLAIRKDPHAPEWRCLLGELLLRDGSPAEAAGELGRIRAMAGTNLSPPAAFWASVLQADLHAASGDMEAARDDLRRILAMQAEHRDPAAEWRLRARLARAGGDAPGAVRAGERFLELQENLLGAAVAEKTLALFEGAADLEAAGRPGEAGTRYEEFLGRWGDADMPVPQVEEARTRLRALAAPPDPS